MFINLVIFIHGWSRAKKKFHIHKRITERMPKKDSHMHEISHFWKHFASDKFQTGTGKTRVTWYHNICEFCVRETIVVHTKTSLDDNTQKKNKFILCHWLFGFFFSHLVHLHFRTFFCCAIVFFFGFSVSVSFDSDPLNFIRFKRKHTNREIEHYKPFRGDNW